MMPGTDVALFNSMLLRRRPKKEAKMKKLSVALVSTMILLCGIWYTDSISAREVLPSGKCLCCTGQCNLTSACAVAHDELRNLVFVGCRDCVCVLDISNPDKPSKISDFEHKALTICALCYDARSGCLFLSKGDLGFEIWDVSDVTSPRKQGNYDTPGYACGLAVKDMHAYVADGDAGVRVIDFSNPSGPYEVAYIEMTCASNITIEGAFAYVADLGLRILDISMPEKPREIAYIPTPGVTHDIYIEDNYAYVADDWCGLRIIDVSDPSMPHEVGYFTTAGYAWDVEVAGSQAYLATCDGGLQVVDVSDPTEPKEVAVKTTPRQALSVVLAGQHAYVAQGRSGLGIYASALTRGNTARIESAGNLAVNY